MALEEDTRDLDISVVVNNVGVLHMTELRNTSLDDMETSINVNCFTIAYMTKVYLERLLTRTHRSAFIQLSSQGGRQPVPTFATYGGTKAFDNNFALSMAPEVKENIDVLVVNPSFTKTPMTSDLKESFVTKMFMSSAEDVVNGSLSYLGRDYNTWGSVNHTMNCFSGDFLTYKA